MADAVGATASHRLLRPGLGIKNVPAEVADGSGLRYDPAVIDPRMQTLAERRFSARRKRAAVGEKETDVAKCCDGGMCAAQAGLRTASRLTVCVAFLAAMASLGGLFWPTLYRDPSGILPALRGQDVVTLLALPALIAAAVLRRCGSSRAGVVWLGLLGYLLYTYIGAAFAYHLNPFFPIYVALFALTMAAIVALASSVGHEAVAGIEGRALPRRATAVFLALVAAMVAIPEIAQIAAYLKTGEIPEFIVRTGGTTSFVYTLDLGVVAPLCVLGAVWLWRRRPWGDVLGGCMLVKGVAMGCALLAMDAFTRGAGGEVDFALTGIYGTIAVASLAMSAWFFSRWRA